MHQGFTRVSAVCGVGGAPCPTGFYWRSEGTLCLVHPIPSRSPKRPLGHVCAQLAARVDMGGFRTMCNCTPCVSVGAPLFAPEPPSHLPSVPQAMHACTQLTLINSPPPVKRSARVHTALHRVAYQGPNAYDLSDIISNTWGFHAAAACVTCAFSALTSRQHVARRAGLTRHD